MDVHQQQMGRPGQHLPTRATVASVSCNDGYSFTKPVRDEIVLVAGRGVAGDVHAGVRVRHRSRVAVDPAQPNLRQVHLIRAELHDELRQAGYEVPPGGLGENITTAGVDVLALPVGTILRFGPAVAPAADSSGPPQGPAEPAPAHPAANASVAAGEGAGAVVARAAEEGAGAVVAAAAHATLDSPTAAAVALLAAHLAAGPPRDGRPAILLTGLRNPCQQINHYRPGLLKHVLGRNPDGTLSRRAGAMAVVLQGGPVRPGAEIDIELPAEPHLPLDRV